MAQMEKNHYLKKLALERGLKRYFILWLLYNFLLYLLDDYFRIEKPPLLYQKRNDKPITMIKRRKKLSNTATRFTSRNRETNTVILRDDRPMIVISSTSWTPDEDFQILIDAAKKYNDVAIISRSTSIVINHPATNLPTILLIITGRGPMKDYYIEKMNRMKLERVEVRLLFFYNLNTSLLFYMMIFYNFDTF
uniref:Uncharacterized protein n=1 Tax=Heterorhabditis bacteriophora TaxID=37862 RepID=A0A1I7WR18_HETBA